MEAPVPPPFTVRVPESEFVKVSAPFEGTMVMAFVRPLNEEVVVPNVMFDCVVVAYPEPRVERYVPADW